MASRRHIAVRRAGSHTIPKIAQRRRIVVPRAGPYADIVSSIFPQVLLAKAADFCSKTMYGCPASEDQQHIVFPRAALIVSKTSRRIDVRRADPCFDPNITKVEALRSRREGMGNHDAVFELGDSEFCSKTTNFHPASKDLDLRRPAAPKAIDVLKARIEAEAVEAGRGTAACSI
ncbi:hypothetical protein EDD18DRAFT_1117820 [Armillaria luteobubalina]|uniref:Uncharacterized protein n=1 Tax=Armillaria luteobubalina TaxID=153913 RepID=A0AA39NW78_9AGAR|nr:hypothetical protein EDD18DRAFT_1117820 [Armillaria luteobubalina]